MEVMKIQLINVFKETIADLNSFNEPCCDDDDIFRKGVVAGLWIAIETIKRGSNRRLVEYALDSYREEHAGKDFKPVGVKD